MEDSSNNTNNLDSFKNSKYQYKEYFTLHEIRSVNELFYLIRERLGSASCMNTILPAPQTYIFRGHSSEEWTMIPSALRNHKSLEDYSMPGGLAWAEPVGKYDTPKDILEYLNYFMRAEVYAVQEFLEEAEQQGIQTGLDYLHLRKQFEGIFTLIENIEITEDKPEGFTNVHELDEFPNPEMSAAFAFSQHFGVPTRLLDFTESPYIALFFAAYNAFQKDLLGNEDGYMSINCLRKSTFYLDEAVSKQLKLVMVPKTINTNLLRQKGLFVSLQKATYHYLYNRRWPSIEEILVNNKATDYLDRLLIPKKMSRAILQRLYDLGIAPYSMMPSLENISKSHSYKKYLFSIQGCTGDKSDTNSHYPDLWKQSINLINRARRNILTTDRSSDKEESQ